eukprot:NODE_6_length_48303_cov_0.387022.p8 type:complete len:632 gc:universal NODE_6_length_48303_cov_0.387022:3153-1258(-)
MPQVTIGYASQTGTAEHISKHICQEMEAMNIDAVVYPLDKYEGVEFVGFHVFVVSSTGDGDAPEHSLPFYKWLRKLKKQEEQKLSGLEYCLLGLGDTNYTNFNGNAKRTLKFFKDLNLVPVFRNVLADDATGLESFVDPWIDELLQYVSKRYRLASSVDAITPVFEELRDFNLGTRSALFQIKIDSTDFKPSRLPAHVKWNVKDHASPCTSLLAFQSSIKSTDDILKKATTHLLISGKCLTMNNSVKTTILVAIKSNGYQYKAGDSIGIFVPNDELLTKDLLKILGHSLDSNPVIQHTEHGEISLYDLLRYKLDLRFPSKRYIRLIAEYCKEEEEKNALLYLTSKEGSSEFARIRGLNLNLLDFLNGLPSCNPPIYSLSLLGVLKPRYYSVVKFDQANDSVDFLFNLETFKSGDIDRVGLATGYIDSLCAHPRVRNKLSITNKPILAFPWPATTFTADPSFPLVFIGPGTGVAPYLQFMMDLKPGQKALLIQGCRGSEEWILQQELESITAMKKIPYYVAYSRSSSCSIRAVHANRIYSSKEIVRVGEKLGYEKIGAYCWDVLATFRTEILQLFDDDAVFYLCGDASHMVKMFMETIKLIISEENNISLASSEKIVQTMVKNKKIRMDVWG